MSKYTICYILISLLLVNLLLSCTGRHRSGDENANLFERIDQEISRSQEYQKDKEKEIEFLRSQLATVTDNNARMIICDRLIEEFESYNSDSTFYYINLNLHNPIVLSNPDKMNELKIKKADITAHAGLFKEAEELLSEINRSRLDTLLLQQYYHAYCDLYQYKIEYNNDGEYLHETELQREAYIDSVTRVSDPTSLIYIINNAAAQTRRGEQGIAEEILLKKIKEYKPGDRNYSILASILADLYKTIGDKENYRRYLGESVISDIKGNIKENMAIRALATECYESGDLERADRYLRQSFADANFYAARMRNAQSSRMLPVIGEAYNHHQKKLNDELRLLVIFISILAFGFIVIAIFAFIQVKKVRRINRHTNNMLVEVSQLSDRLSKVNEELSLANEELQSSNRIRGEYGVLFMEYSSLAISSLQQYQQSLRVAAAQGNLQNLIKKIESANFENKIVAEFYSKFDEAILNIYPHFVEKINNLLKPEDRIILKPRENLNTELRVFALIRIGISDSEKIAKFLRCSLTTVYTYRSKMKKKAIEPETFEDDLMRI